MTARVLHLCHRLCVGGLERAVLDLARHARSRGHDDRVLLFDAAEVDPVHDLAPEGVPVAFAPRPSHGARLPRHARAIARIRAAVRAIRPRVLHAHNDTALVYAAAVVPRSPRADAPALVATFHNRPVHATLTARLACRLAARRASAVIAVSEELARWLCTTGWVERSEVVENGVDVARFTAREHRSVPGAPLHVAMIARAAPGKRHDLAVEGVAALRARGADVRLTLVGDGPLRERLAALAAGQPCVAWRPRVADVPAFLQTVDVFLLLSDHEGTPLAVLEALGSGIPVVASDTGGLPALVTAGTGTLVPHEPAAIAAALAAFAPAERRRTAGAAARARIESRFALASVARRYEEHYRRAGATRGSA